MKNLDFPLHFRFRVGTLANDFVITDDHDRMVGYVRQKLFRFVEEIQVFTDETRSEIQYVIKANKWIDFSASYLFYDANGEQIGRVARKGVASLWKARYLIFDKNDRQLFSIQEEKGWTKVWDALLGEVPVIGMFTGYFFNPSYKVTRSDDHIVARLTKDKSFFGRKFTVNKHCDLREEEQENIMLSLMMMILLERKRG